MSLVEAKCTQCGASIQVDDTKEAGSCKYCGTAFITEKVISNYNTEEFKKPERQKVKIFTKENIKALINGVLFGLIIVFVFIIGSIAFILDMEFLFDVFDIGKKKKNNTILRPTIPTFNRLQIVTGSFQFQKVAKSRHAV